MKMKKHIVLAATLLMTGTASMAASPDVMVKAIASCCEALAACCGLSLPCCP
jgi:hypothetical protein